MFRRLISTLLVLFLLYLLSTGPVHRLEKKGVVPQSFYETFYRPPIAALENVPVAGPLLRRYIVWCTDTPIPGLTGQTKDK